MAGIPTVAVVCRSFGQPGGAEGWARQQARALAASGRVEVHVVCAEEGAVAGPWKLHTVRTPRVTGFWHKWTFACRVQRVLDRHRFDWVHTHDPLPGAHFSTTGPPHYFWATQVRGKRWPGLNDWVTIGLERRMFEDRKFRLALPMSAAIAEALVRAYPALAGRTRVVRPMPEGPLPSAEELARLRQEQRAGLGLGEGERLILFAGNNFRLKGLDHVLNAMGEELRAGRRWHLLVVGRGDAAEFTQMAGALGVGKWVRFVGLETRPMERWYAAADLVVLPSKFETFGMVVPEAMRAGCPVVVTRSVGAAELVRSGETGWVVDGGASLPGVLAVAWESDLAAMGAAARRSMDEGTGPESLAEPLLEVILGGGK